MVAAPFSPLLKPTTIRVSGLLLTLFLPSIALAGSVTAESIWSRSDARSRALQQVPDGAKVIRTHCQEFQVGIGNFRYRCNLEFEADPSKAPKGVTTP